MLHLRPGISSWLRSAAWTVVVLAGMGAMGTLLGRPAARQSSSAAASAGQVTFNRDIAPIVFRSCATCHRQGEAAPFSLLNYSDVKKHARQIAEASHASISGDAGARLANTRDARILSRASSARRRRPG